MLLIINNQKKEYQFTVEENEIVGGLISKLEELLQIDETQISLIFNNMKLEKYGEPLQSYGIIDGSHIDLQISSPKLQTNYHYASILVVSICQIIWVLFTSKFYSSNIDYSTKATILISNIIMIGYLLLQIVFKFVFDEPFLKSFTFKQFIAIACTTMLIFVLMFFEIDYSVFETNVLCSVVGGMLCMNCVFVLLYCHYQISKCYNKFNEFVKLPEDKLFSIIACPTFLFEGLFFTSFMFCTNFTITSMIFCIVNWIIMFVLSKKQFNDYKEQFDGFSVKYAMIPLIW